MSQKDPNIVTLSTKRGNAYALALCSLIVSLAMIGLTSFCFKVVMRGGPKLPAAIINIVALGIFGGVVYVLFTLRKPHTPDELEVSSTKLRYVANGEETSAPWSKVGVAETYTSSAGRTSYEGVRLTVFDRVFSFDPAKFGLSAPDIIGLINAARSGQPMKPEEWFAARSRRRSLTQIFWVVAGVAIVILISHFGPGKH
jgi:hypothetical protein